MKPFSFSPLKWAILLLILVAVPMVASAQDRDQYPQPPSRERSRQPDSQYPDSQYPDSQRPQTSDRNTGGDEQWEIGHLIQTAGQYIDEFWTQTLRDNNQRYISPRLIRVPRPIHNVMYDPNANVIYCDYDFLEQQMEQHGDFAVVTILAHEWAHAVQTQLGTRFSLPIQREL